MYFSSTVGLIAPTFLYFSIAAVAAPTATTSGKSTTITANFDDVPAPNPVGLFNPLPTPYDLLSFMDLEAGNNLTELNGIPFAGLKAHTPPNVVGTSSLINDVMATFPTITTNYTGSTVKNFTLHSMWFACIAGPANRIGQDCSILYTGTHVGGSTVQQTCAYTSAEQNVMDECVFGAGFSGLSSVTMRPVSATLGAVTADTLFDSVAYTVYQRV